MDILNKRQALALFEREALLLGAEDGIPKQRAIELFGKNIIEYLEELDLRSDTYHLFKSWDTEHVSTRYLTKAGTLLAVSESNVAALERKKWHIVKKERSMNG